MRVALVGSGGYIAGFLADRFDRHESIETVLKIDQSENADGFLNLSEPEKFNYASLENVDFIVFTAAISGPDKCAVDFEFCWDINVTGTIYFIKEAVKRNCRVLFFSSDAVFGDIPGEIYTESSVTKAETPYGRMKKTVEDTFRSSPYFKAIRLSYVVSAKDRFVSYCLGCIERKEAADIFHPFYRNCIGISDVVNVVVWMLEHWWEYRPYVLNVSGKELVSRVRIADELNRLFNGRLTYTISNPGDDFYRNRPPVTQMTSLYMHQYGIIEDNTFTEKLKKELSLIIN